MHTRVHAATDELQCTIVYTGRTEIGTSAAPSVPDIIIQGTGVEAEHCFIDNIHDVITLYPLAKMCAVDGVLVSEPTRLPQGQYNCCRETIYKFEQPYPFNQVFTSKHVSKLCLRNKN